MSTPTLAQRHGMAWNAAEQARSALGYARDCVMVSTGADELKLAEAVFLLTKAATILDTYSEET